MTDRQRIDGGNGRSSKLMCPSNYAPADFATFLADLKAGNVYVDVTANNSTGADAGVTVIGTALNKANLLSNETAQGFGFEVSDDATINDVLARIAVDYIEGTLVAGQTTLTLTDTRIKTTSTIDVYTDDWEVQPASMTVANGSISFVFTAQASNVGVKVRVF